MYSDFVKPFHDRVNDTKNSVRDDDEPKGQPADIGTLYSSLVIAATVSSGYDRGRVTPFQSIWNEIDNVQDAFSEALEHADGGAGRRAVGHQFGEQALCLLKQLYDAMRKYNDWLECELTRRWWQWKRCRELA